MRYHQEAPDTRIDRYGCIAGMVAALLAGDWLALRIASDLERPHPAEFVALALLLGLLLCLTWLLFALFTVRYELAGDRLALRQGWQRLEVDLDEEVHLHRWRNRWAWEEGVRRDLGVEAAALYPPVWPGRSGSVWVLAFSLPDGQRKAVAFRPSPALLSLVKERVRSREQTAG